jgi:hypothetical protein
VVARIVDAEVSGTVCAAKVLVLRFDPVTDDTAPAMLTAWSERVYGAFEAVEGMNLAAECDGEDSAPFLL